MKLKLQSRKRELEMSDKEINMESDINDKFEKKDKKSLSFRTIKTFVLRQGRMTSAQERDYEELYPVWCIDYKEEYLDFEKIFGNKNPVIIEIGFGMGAATVQIANNNPDINYLGIEVHRPGVGKVLGDIKTMGLKNLFIIQYDALDVL